MNIEIARFIYIFSSLIHEYIHKMHLSRGFKSPQPHQKEESIFIYSLLLGHKRCWGFERAGSEWMPCGHPEPAPPARRQGKSPQPHQQKRGHPASFLLVSCSEGFEARISKASCGCFARAAERSGVHCAAWNASNAPISVEIPPALSLTSP